MFSFFLVIYIMFSIRKIPLKNDKIGWNIASRPNSDTKYYSKYDSKNGILTGLTYIFPSFSHRWHEFVKSPPLVRSFLHFLRVRHHISRQFRLIRCHFTISPVNIYIVCKILTSFLITITIMTVNTACAILTSNFMIYKVLIFSSKTVFCAEPNLELKNSCTSRHFEITRRFLREAEFEIE